MWSLFDQEKLKKKWIVKSKGKKVMKKKKKCDSRKIVQKKEKWF